MSEQICRLCLCGSSNLKNIFDGDNDLATKIYELTQIEIQHNDNYPLEVCFNCIRLLEIAWKFRKQVQESNVFIIKHYGNYRETTTTTVVDPSPREEIAEVVDEIEECSYSKSFGETIEFSLETENNEPDYEEYETIEELDLQENPLKEEFSAEIFDEIQVDEKLPEKEDVADFEYEEIDMEADETITVSPIPESDEEYNATETTAANQSSDSNVCPICAKVFKTAGYLSKHMVLHTGEKPFKCEECGRSFAMRSVYTIHLRMHSGKRPYTCQDCGKSFTHKGNLKVHLRSHTGERPYSCIICDKSFSQIGNLQTHHRMHSDERNFDCTQCKKTFKTFSNLKEHMLLHTDNRPYACTVCDYKAVKISSFKNHMRIHTGERPFACTFCPKTFANSSNFNSHVRIHTQEKPYACKFCGLKFIQSTSRARHELRIHLNKLKAPKDVKVKAVEDFEDDDSVELENL